MDFSFEQFAAKATVTREFRLDAVSEDQANPIILIVRHAGDGNPGFTNHAYKTVNKGQARGGKVTPELVQTRIAEAVDAFARTVVVGWKNVSYDGKNPSEPPKGTPVPFSVEMVGKLLTALTHPIKGRSDVFLSLQRYCESADNFSDPAVDAADLGKG